MKLSKMKITTDLIAKFNPCQSRFDNWKLHHNDFKGDILDFLSLTTITPQDKVWVACRIMPRDLIEVFAIDCAVSAADYAALSADYAALSANYAAAGYAAASADYAAGYADVAADYGADYAADYAALSANYAAAGYAAASADYAAGYADVAAAAERERQIDALIYLVMNYN